MLLDLSRTGRMLLRTANRAVAPPIVLSYTFYAAATIGDRHETAMGDDGRETVGGG